MIDTNNFLGLGLKENETMPWGSKYNVINVRELASDINKALVHSSLTPCLMPPSFLIIGVLKIWILENCGYKFIYRNATDNILDIIHFNFAIHTENI